MQLELESAPAPGVANDALVVGFAVRAGEPDRSSCA